MPRRRGHAFPFGDSGMSERERELESALALLLYHVEQMRALFPNDSALVDAISDAECALNMPAK
jgi:hypothetical protein